MPRFCLTSNLSELTLLWKEQGTGHRAQGKESMEHSLDCGFRIAECGFEKTLRLENRQKGREVLESTEPFQLREPRVLYHIYFSPKNDDIGVKKEF
jgi:hypothetical protein